MGRMLVLGAGGHAKVVVEALRAVGHHEVAGVLDARSELWGFRCAGVEVLGGDALLPRLVADGVRMGIVGVGSAGPTLVRRALFELLLKHDVAPVSALHPRATISPSASIGDGTVALASSVVNAEAILGRNVIVNTASVVEHDCRIGDHVHVASGARICGNVTVGEGAHVGAGATVVQGVRIGPSAIVGAGAVVLSDVPPGAKVAGVPARPLAAPPREDSA